MASALIGRLGTDTALPVSVLMDHDGPLVAVILAVIRSGHVVVVLDPMLPVSQLSDMVAEVESVFLIHDVKHRDTAKELASEIDMLEAVDSDLLDDAPVEPPSRGPRSPAMLAFTSGTSGGAKAAVITHGLLLNLVRGATNAFGIGPADRMPMLFPTSMAVAAYPMFLPLLNGGTLVTLDVRSLGFAPVGPFLRDERISVAYLAPTVVRFLADAVRGQTFPDLRMIALGGEGIDADAVELTRSLFKPKMVGVGYGTTETGVVSLAAFDGDNPSPPVVPSGFAVPDVELFVLDDAGSQVAPGTSGEIAVCSPHIFAGYRGHPELDAVVVGVDPRDRVGWRLYRTGDHGHLDDDGALVVEGRIDTKVKIRGRFVVLGDVEAALHDLDEVAAAAVVARSRAGISELVAYVVSAAGELEPTRLRAKLLERFEAYRVPSAWVLLDELPRLPNGKTDRRSLPSIALPELADGGAGSVRDPDHGGAEEQGKVRSGPGRRWVDVADADPRVQQLRLALTSIWQDLLPCADISIDDDFMHLGGDSLLAAQMLVLVEQRLGVIVPMGDLIHARTIRTLSDVLQRRLSATSATSTVACVQDSDSSRPRLWFVHDLQGSAYRLRNLADGLGSDQALWSFESPLLRGEPNTFRDLGDFAASYVADMRREQPTGPYWLGGYSFGGICAYEMARQLAADGEEVAFLAVVDVGPGYRGPGWHARRSPFRPWFGVAKPPDPGVGLLERGRHYLDMARSGPARISRHLMVRTGLARLIDPIRFRRDLHTHGRVRPSWRLWYAWEEHWKLAARSWDRANVYGGVVDLFWADDTPSADSTLGWGQLVGTLRIHGFPGDHIGVLEERGAPALARVLRDVMDERLGAQPEVGG